MTHSTGGRGESDSNAKGGAIVEWPVLHVAHQRMPKYRTRPGLEEAAVWGRPETESSLAEPEA